MKRTFIAVDAKTGDEIKNLISHLRSELRNETIKWVNPENMHITMAFLGDTKDEMIMAVTSMLKDQCTGFGEFEFTLRGLGVFRNIFNPRVIWAGIDRSEKFATMFQLITYGLNSLDIKTEEGQFNPHLTLGRVKFLNNKNDLRRLIDEYNEKEFQKVPVNGITFYESILTQQGPIYKPIIRCNL